MENVHFTKKKYAVKMRKTFKRLGCYPRKIYKYKNEYHFNYFKTKRINF